MPIREYKCKDCGNYTEVIQGINEKPLETCAECGGKLEKLISNSSFVLKGSGWYKTDYGASKTESKTPKNTGQAKTGEVAPVAPAGTAPAAAAPSCPSASDSCKQK